MPQFGLGDKQVTKFTGWNIMLLIVLYVWWMFSAAV